MQQTIHLHNENSKLYIADTALHLVAGHVKDSSMGMFPVTSFLISINILSTINDLVTYTLTKSTEDDIIKG